MPLVGLDILADGAIDPGPPLLRIGRVSWRPSAGQIRYDPAQQLQLGQPAAAAVDQHLHMLVHAIRQPEGDEWRHGICGPFPTTRFRFVRFDALDNRADPPEQELVARLIKLRRRHALCARWRGARSR
eukprot:6958863-Prymnesium_polylepis.1